MFRYSCLCLPMSCLRIECGLSDSVRDFGCTESRFAERHSGQRYKVVVDLAGTKPGGNPSAPCHATCAPVYGERLRSFSYREIVLVRHHQAHRSCLRRICFALPLTAFRRPSETFLANVERISQTVVECNGARPWAGLNELPGDLSIYSLKCH
jgi:hypothetical protein